jgi:hypothetical protein
VSPHGSAASPGKRGGSTAAWLEKSRTNRRGGAADLTLAEEKSHICATHPESLSISEFSVDLRHTSPKHNVETAPRRAGHPRALCDVLAYRLVQNVTFPERKM